MREKLESEERNAGLPCSDLTLGVAIAEEEVKRALSYKRFPVLT